MLVVADPHRDDIVGNIRYGDASTFIPIVPRPVGIQPIKNRDVLGHA